MSDPLSPQVSDRICKHMNDDHAEAVLLYAKVFGNTANATAAQMVSIDPEGMNLLTQTEAGAVPVRVGFDHVLQDSEDAHQTLITMVKQSRQAAK